MIESSESQSLVCENDILIVDVVSDWEELTYVDWSGSIEEYLRDEELWDILEVEDHEDATTVDDEDARSENNEVVRVENNDVVGADDNDVAGAEDNEVVGVENNDVVGADDNEVAGAEDNEVVGVENNDVVGVDDNDVAGADDNEVARDPLMENAKALYLIMESCGSKRFSLISDIHSAKDAWHALREAHDEEMSGKYLDSEYDIPGSYSSPLSLENTHAQSF